MILTNYFPNLLIFQVVSQLPNIMMLRSKVFDLMIPTDFSAFHALESLRAATVGAKRTSTGRSAP